MDATEYSDDRAGPTATTGMMTLLRFPSDGPDACSQPHDHRHAGAETLTSASSGSTASNRADGPDACSRPHDHRHADGIIPNHPGASSGSTASNCADGAEFPNPISVFVTALAFATLAALVTYSQAHSQRLAVNPSRLTRRPIASRRRPKQEIHKNKTRTHCLPHTY